MNKTKKMLTIGLVSTSLMVFAIQTHAACQTVDTSQAGAILLRTAIHIGDAELVKKLVEEKCIAPAATIAGGPQDHAGFLANNAEIFNLYAKYGFRSTAKTQEGKSFLMRHLFASKEKPVLDAWLKKQVLDAFDTYKIAPKNAIDKIEDKKNINKQREVLLLSWINGVDKEELVAKDQEKNNAAHYAVQFGNEKLISAIHKRFPELFRQKNNYGFTPWGMVGACAQKSEPLDLIAERNADDWKQKTAVYGYEAVFLSPMQAMGLLGVNVKKWTGLVPDAADTAEAKKMAEKHKAMLSLLNTNYEKAKLCGK
jgi:hypothetical protein